MRYLLDVNVLLAAIWQNHSRHTDAFAWLDGKETVLCPIAELGFLRISTNKKVFNASMTRARELLRKFSTERNAGRIPDDLPALNSTATASENVTDQYLADLAGKHGLKFATLDKNIVHSVVELIGSETDGAKDKSS